MKLKFTVKSNFGIALVLALAGCYPFVTAYFLGYALGRTHGTVSWALVGLAVVWMWHLGTVEGKRFMGYLRDKDAS